VSIITLTTDFGTGSPYVAAMKGVILSINPAVTLVDLTHQIPPQDVRQGAIVLDDVTRWFPDDTIHVTVIDPGVGTDRPIVYACVGQQHYVAPDNGILSRLSQRTRPSAIVRLNNPEYWLATVSKTFHGRDIMAPVAAHLSLGVAPHLLGIPAETIGEIDWPKVNVTPERIEGSVIGVDSFGNLVTNISAELFAGRPMDERVCIVCSIYETYGIFNTYADHPHGTFFALVDSAGRLELAMVGESAATRLGIEPGMPVVLAWD
jgi:S-adenosylmethionine hydrolase